MRCVANARFSVKERGQDKRAGGFAACGQEGDALPTSAWPCSAPRGQKPRGRDRRLNASASEAVRTICHVEKQRQQRHRPHGGRAHLGSAQPRRAPRRAPVSPSPTFSSSTVWLNRTAFSASTVNWRVKSCPPPPRAAAPQSSRSGLSPVCRLPNPPPRPAQLSGTHGKFRPLWVPYRGFTTNFLLPEPGRWSAAVCRFDGHAPDKSQIIPAPMAKLANRRRSHSARPCVGEENQLPLAENLKLRAQVHRKTWKVWLGVPRYSLVLWASTFHDPAEASPPLHPPPHARTQPHTHAHTHARTRTRARTHAHARAHTHAHACTHTANQQQQQQQQRALAVSRGR